MTENTVRRPNDVSSKLDRAMLLARTAERQGAAPLVTRDDIERAARELVAAYGHRAIALMRARTRAVRRRGDDESALLWRAVGEAVAQQLGVNGFGD